MPLLIDRGDHRFLFFALFSVVGKTSAFIGPFVSDAIISASGNNNNMPFAFLFSVYVSFGVCTCARVHGAVAVSSGAFSAVFLVMVDMDKSRKECAEFIEAEAKAHAFAKE